MLKLLAVNDIFVAQLFFICFSYTGLEMEKHINEQVTVVHVCKIFIIGFNTGLFIIYNIKNGLFEGGLEEHATDRERICKINITCNWSLFA